MTDILDWYAEKEPGKVDEWVRENYDVEDSTQTPSDVAETWMKALDAGHHILYTPHNAVDVDTNSSGSMFKLDTYGPVVYDDGDVTSEPDRARPWFAKKIETVSAEDVPATQVPADD